MKSIKKFLFILVVAVTCGIYSSSAQVYIKVRPPRPPHPHVRIEAPSPRHVWIEDDWEPRGGVYADIGGRWIEPPRPAVVWVPGHWRHTHHGWYWIPGHWR